MNIKEVRSLLNQQTEKVAELKQELQKAEEEQARLEDIEKKLNQEYQQKISQAVNLLKEAQTIADCDQETVFNAAWTEYEKDRQPSETELAVLQQLKDQLKIFTELNSGLPEEDQIGNKQKLLTLIDGGVTQPVNEPEEVIKEPVNEPEIVSNDDASINKLEEIKKAIDLATASVTLPELKKITASLGFTKNIYQSLENYLETASESDLLQLISKFIIYVPETKEFFNTLDYSIDIKTIRTIEYAGIPLDKLELSNKVHAACLNFQIKNVGLLIGQMQYNDGRSLNVGTAGRKEIREKLNSKLGIVFDSESTELIAA